MFLPIAFFEAFMDSFDADDVRDSVCNIMESNCTETLKFNNLTVDGCKNAYDKLNMSDNGYLDSNTKGCRIVHSTFVPINTGHCPHLSFAQLQDEKGMIKCQESRGRKPSDLFSPQELENIGTKGQDLGFPTNLTRSCTTKDLVLRKLQLRLRQRFLQRLLCRGRERRSQWQKHRRRKQRFSTNLRLLSSVCVSEIGGSVFVFRKLSFSWFVSWADIFI